MTPYIRLHKTIFERFSQGETIAALAEDYNLSAQEAEQMLQVQAQTMLLPKAKAQLNKLLAKYVRGQVSSMNYKALTRAAIYAHLHGLEMPEWAYLEYRLTCKDLMISYPPMQ